ncbi:helix-turn-helix domain-containing protein [Pelagirhabdus alkalitolerans]|uniref:helix-turn-helix domain-containing protein n=1 Tax=Pelagirhabdus alkalitolerans TaxID=1612202 RepID=UPI001FE04942|nr:helix-turn-helix transcriptional regulator [Pelagirhabdus alkalitolerans]
MANKLNVSRQSISKWESEEEYPSIETLIDLSYAFEISLDELLKSDQDLTEKIIIDSKKTLISKA